MGMAPPPPSASSTATILPTTPALPVLILLALLYVITWCPQLAASLVVGEEENELALRLVEEGGGRDWDDRIVQGDDGNNGTCHSPDFDRRRRSGSSGEAGEIGCSSSSIVAEPGSNNAANHSLSVASSPGVESNSRPNEVACADEDAQCPQWADSGECEANPSWMLINCRHSCSMCDDEDGDNNEEDYVDAGESFGMRQTYMHSRITRKRLLQSTDYMENTVMVDPYYESVRDGCKNRNEFCTYWAAMGECEAKPTYMQTNCGPACMKCEYQDYEKRCQLDPSAKDAIAPGDLNRLFERIVDPTSQEFAKYQPVILAASCRPGWGGGGAVASDGNYKIGPWVVTLDNFLSGEECDRLIQMGHDLGYQRSKTVTFKRNNGTRIVNQNNFARTSENTFCVNECSDGPVTVRVKERMSNVTAVPVENFEVLQLLGYKFGQFYLGHSDYMTHSERKQSGPRILTFLLYLNDVEEGGGTKFLDLDLTVWPKKGRALLWPNVLDKDPSAKDKRVRHAALPVGKGSTKFAANAWIHLRDHLAPLERGCG